MKINHFDTARRLTDPALLAAARNLASRERGATAALIAHLAEIETRRLHLATGYSSMFAYCRDVLLLSEDAACNRIQAARAARSFPLLLDLLETGAVSLTAARLLAPHLTDANHADVLASAHGLSKPQVEELVARLAPKPDVPVSIRKLPAPAAPHSLLAAEPSPAPAAPPAPSPSPMLAPAPSIVTNVPSRPGRTVSPLSPDRYKLQLTISGATLDKLREVKDLLRHANPSGDEAAIIDRALTLLLADVKKEEVRRDGPVRIADAGASLGRRVRGQAAAGRGPPRRIRAGRRTLWFRERGRQTLRGARLPRVPSRQALRQRRGERRDQYRAALPQPQRPRMESGIHGHPADRRGVVPAPTGSGTSHSATNYQRTSSVADKSISVRGHVSTRTS